MTARIALALLLTLPAGVAGAENAPPPGFKKLTSAQIRQAFTGHTFTDEVHFTLLYQRGGMVTGMSMGKKASHKWSIAKDALCEAEPSGTKCYFVWAKGKSVSLMPQDRNLSIDGVLK